MRVSIMSSTFFILFIISRTDGAHGYKLPQKGAVNTILKHPWLVSIQTNHNPYCAGSIISAQTVLTAASCFDPVTPSNLTVRVGDHRGSEHKVNHLRLHRYFSFFPNGRSVNDVALLNVSPPLVLGGGGAEQLKLNDRDVVAPGRLASIAGWRYSKKHAAVELRKYKLRIVGCGGGNSTEGQICASPGTGIVCEGDFGGPLIVNRAQVGIKPWGSDCARPNRPGVFTRVSRYRDWIEKNSHGIYLTRNVKLNIH